MAGSTYVHGAEQALISAEGQQVTLGKAAGLLGAVGPAWNALTPGSLPELGGVAGGSARPPARRGELAHARDYGWPRAMPRAACPGPRSWET